MTLEWLERSRTEGRANCINAGLTARVAQSGKHRRITSTGNDGLRPAPGADDLHAGRARDIANHVVQLQIHIGERFLLVAALVLMLHRLDVRGSVVEMTLAGAQVNTQCRNVAPGTKAGA